jgi:rhodanese-related sulfurtransferase
MIAVWVLPFIRRRLFLVSVVLFTGLGFCLILTSSRGATAGLATGLLILVALVRPSWDRQTIVAIALSLTALIASFVYLNAYKRYTPAFVLRDKSIANRLEIWKKVPRMMADAPSGWGKGRAGPSYVNWYQALESKEEGYPSLVSSHFTSLVELDWFKRYLYLFGWLAAAAICIPRRDESLRWFAVPFSVWVAFGVSAIFSNVTAPIWLWLVPLAGLTAVVIARLGRRMWPTYRFLVGCAGASAVVLVSLYAVGAITPGDPVRGSARSVRFGGPAAPYWLIANPAAIGERHGKTLRRYLQNHSQNDTSIGFAQKADGVPQGFNGTVFLIGDVKVEDIDSISAQRIVVVNPTCFPEQLDSVSRKISKVLIGEFSQSPSASAWMQMPNAERLIGVGDFLPNWPEIVLNGDKGLTPVSEVADQGNATEATSIPASPIAEAMVVESVSLDVFRQGVEARSGAILDARPEIFYRLGHIPGALSLSREEFDNDYAKLRPQLEKDKQQPIFVYCSDASCEDSQTVAERLGQLGYTNVAVFKGGWAEWGQAKLPQERSPP